ncbi:hypothetical protein CCP3SC15_2720003 [Gammaproteobacteria bacterium]
MPEDNSWEAKQAKRYIEIPTDPAEKLAHYIRTELIVSARDIKSIVKLVLTLTAEGTDREEVVAAALDSFPN